MAILLSCVTGWYLAGLSWTVAIVTYPGFASSASGDWPKVHEFHSRRIAVAVGPMWAIEAISCGLWLLQPPSGTLWLGIAASASAAVTVAVTILWAVPIHQRLEAGYDKLLARSLRSAHALRTAAWTTSALAAAIALGGQLT